MSTTASTTITWGSGEPIPGTPFRTLVPTAATDGRLVVLSADMPPEVNVPEHTHEHEDQITVVMAGTVGATIGGEHYLLEEGAAVFMPRGVPHAQWNEGTTPARILEIYTPGGFEQVFEAAGAGRPIGPPVSP